MYNLELATAPIAWKKLICTGTKIPTGQLCSSSFVLCGGLLGRSPQGQKIFYNLVLFWQYKHQFLRILLSNTLHGIIMSVIITTGILMTGKNMTYFLKTVKFIPVMFIHRHFITCWNTFWWIDDSFMYTKFEVLFFGPWNLLHFLFFNIIYRLMKHNIMYIQSFKNDIC